MFSEEEINKLPEHSKYDHAINLMPGTTAPFGPIYPLSEGELECDGAYELRAVPSGNKDST